jgi:Zn-dependent M28 family amino/carboxypeptidase
VFWVNEENGGAGGKAYHDLIGDQVKNHVAAIEMDGGAEKPLGFGVTAGAQTPAAVAHLKDVGTLLERIGAGSISSGGGGADIGPIMSEGVPGLALRTIGTHYFDWHHSRADTIDKIDLDDFRRNIAAMAVMAYVLADMPERIVEY